MIDEKAKAILLRAFSCWDEQERENIRQHLRNETPVLCGAPFWTVPVFKNLEGTIDEGG